MSYVNHLVRQNVHAEIIHSISYRDKVNIVLFEKVNPLRKVVSLVSNTIHLPNQYSLGKSQCHQSMRNKTNEIYYIINILQFLPLDGLAIPSNNPETCGLRVTCVRTFLHDRTYRQVLSAGNVVIETFSESSQFQRTH